MGDIIVLVVLGLMIALAIRSMWKNHKNGKHCGCSGDCGACCSGSCNCKSEKQK